MQRTAGVESYSATAKLFHWVVAAFVLVLIPAGILMTNLPPGPLQGRIYDSHKLAGFVLLWIVVARLVYRLFRGVPADEPTLEPWQRIVSHVVHWALYAALIAQGLLGWIGISAYPANQLFGGAITIPAIVGKDTAFAERIFSLHVTLGFVIAGLVAMHIGAALFHWLIRRDNVMQRMLPGGRPRRAGVLRQT